MNFRVKFYPILVKLYLLSLYFLIISFEASYIELCHLVLIMEETETVKNYRFNMDNVSDNLSLFLGLNCVHLLRKFLLSV